LSRSEDINAAEEGVGSSRRWTALSSEGVKLFRDEVELLAKDIKCPGGGPELFIVGVELSLVACGFVICVRGVDPTARLASPGVD